MISRKPSYSGPEYASRFKDPDVARAYLCRPPYPSETFHILSSLLPTSHRRVLDVGCGTGEIARNLVNYADSVDAVDFSKSMIELGRRLPGGANGNLRWIVEKVEEAHVYPPYSLITEGESLHWMDWDAIFPLFRRILTAQGHLALVERKEDEEIPWKDQLLKIMAKYSTDPKYEQFDMAANLEKNGLFQKQGESRTLPITLTQTLEDYVESFHSWSEFSRSSMHDNAGKFDNEVRSLVSSFTLGNPVERKVSALVIWGRPKPYQ
jgi:ubiquinone/menaquinone biosynthesis C-methylase UbiE